MNAFPDGSTVRLKGQPTGQLMTVSHSHTGENGVGEPSKNYRRVPLTSCVWHTSTGEVRCENFRTVVLQGESNAS